VANPAHLEKLCEGPKAWNIWREANPNIVPDLSEIQLTLHQRQLGPSNGGPIDLHGADLERAILRYATLSGANLEGSRLVGADLTHARLDNTKLAGADLTDAKLDQADLTGAVLDQTVLFGADLSDTRNLTLPQIEEAFGDASTKLPSNFLPPESWFPNDDVGDEDDYADWGMAAYQEPVELSLYEILELEPKATSEEIRTNYRNLVKKLHPDLNPNDEEAQERFKQVTTAYRILNDAEQRARYDRNEIDGEGRVNPEFEARRRFRRTAFRYYSAAAGSFIIACGVLVGIWYTVLSLEPQEDVPPPPQITATGPKSSERLGRIEPQAPAKSIRRDQDDIAVLEEEQQRLLSGTTPAGDIAPQVQEEAAAPADPDGGEAVEEKATEEMPAADHEMANVAPEPGESVAEVPFANEPAPPTEPDASKASAPIPSPDNAASASPATEMAGTAAPQTPAVAPPAPPPGQAAPTPQPVTEAKQPAAPAQTALQKGTVQRPLRDRHNSTAGQIKPSAPESWSVAALPSSAWPGWTENTRPAQAGFGAKPVSEKSPVPRWSQSPVGRDIVSQVLRARAIRQALGEGKRPLASAQGFPLPERRTGPGHDFPTNALPGKGAAPSPIKPVEASLQRKRADNGASSASMAPSGKARNGSQGANRENRRQQAVSDILAGGL